MAPEYIAAIASLLALIITMGGWLVTYLTQRSILRSQIQAELEISHLKRRFDADLEKLRQLNQKRFADLDEMTKWAQKGHELEDTAYELWQVTDYLTERKKATAHQVRHNLVA